MACGSTIGPLTAAAIGVPTVDIGVPSLAMHSIRETVGNLDGWYLFEALSCFFQEELEQIYNAKTLFLQTQLSAHILLAMPHSNFGCQCRPVKVCKKTQEYICHK